MPAFDNEMLDQLRSVVQSSTPLVFLVGAGVSKDVPSRLPTWPQLTSLVAEHLSAGDAELQRKVADALKQVRPELFFQVLYNHISDDALLPLQVLNPSQLNATAEIVHPNALHYFLAEMLVKGHVVLTPNFDDLIERAYQAITSTPAPTVILDHDCSTLASDVATLAPGSLIKFHGSFQHPDGTACYESIIATLHHVQRELPTHKASLLHNLIHTFDFFVMGYSGQDDYDIYPFLINAPPGRAVYWIRHPLSTPHTWTVLSPTELEKQSKDEGPKVPSLRSYEIINSNAIVLSYKDRGYLIEAATGELIDRIGHSHRPAPSWYEADVTNLNRERVDARMRDLLATWSATISDHTRPLIVAGVLEVAGGSLFLGHALDHIGSLPVASFDARLKASELLYKSERVDEAKASLESLMQDCNELVASVHAQLTLVYNRLAIKQEGLIPLAIEHGRQAVRLFAGLAEADRQYGFELALGLRGAALAMMRAIPDISAIDQPPVKDHCNEILRQAAQMCDLSVRLLQKIGNRSGERGQGQSRNVLGLIQLKLGRFKEAREEFSAMLDLSGRSRFLRESFQAYRNLGLSEYRLACEDATARDKLLPLAIYHFDLALVCLGGEAAVRSKKLEGDPFNAILNRSLARLELGDSASIDKAKENLAALLPDSPNWHWQGRVLGALVEAHIKCGDDFSQVSSWIEQWLMVYEGRADEAIQTMLFGVQNARECVEVFSRIVGQLPNDIAAANNALCERIATQAGRLSKLTQHVPAIPLESWSELVRRVETEVLQKI